MNKEVVIIGAGGHAKVIADIIIKSGDKVVGFLDDNSTKESILGYPVLGKSTDCEKYKDKFFIIAIGNNSVRRRIAQQYSELKYYTAVHPTAAIGLDVKIGEGTCVMAYSVINSSATVGKHVIVNSASVVEHDCVLEDFVHLSPNVSVCGTSFVGKGTHLGSGATVINNHNICAECIIGAGAVVNKNIDESGTYVGVPVKKI